MELFVKTSTFIAQSLSGALKKSPCQGDSGGEAVSDARHTYNTQNPH